MIIDRPAEAALIRSSEAFYAYCNPICMMKGVNRIKKGGEKPDQLWVSDYEGNGLIPISQGTFLSGEIQTVMNSGIVAFRNEEDARRLASKYGGELLDASSFRSRFEKPDRNVTVILDENGMRPFRIIAEKNDVVSITVEYRLEREDRLIIRGYDNLAPIVLNSGGETVTVTLAAVRAGDGFPIVSMESDQVVGQLTVHGSHTTEEET